MKIDDPNHPNEDIDIIDYLIDCDGIIFLLDPDPDEQNRNKDSYSTMLFELFLEFNKRNRQNSQVDNQRLGHYIAFCVTKVDHDKIWEEARNKGADEYVEELIAPMMTLEDLSNDIWLELDKDKRNERTQYNRCQFFYTSCLGRSQENGKSHSIYIPDQTSSKESEPTPEPEINWTWNRTDDYSYAYDNQEYYNNTEETKSSGNSSDDPYASVNNSENNSPSKDVKKVGGTIKSGAKLQPINLIEPIEWLIEGIRLHPPLRKPRK